MADRHFAHARHGLQERREVVAIEVVACVDAQAAVERHLRRLRIRGERFCLSRSAECAGIAFGIQLDAVGARFLDGLHRLRHGVHEQAHAHAE